ncbi:MAG: hypothetical protein H6747_02855 [Deltaproteobacteria bacterium]|nr:hypothetical protein [Deltaproteobacteria bacterium]
MRDRTGCVQGLLRSAPGLVGWAALVALASGCGAATVRQEPTIAMGISVPEATPYAMPEAADAAEQWRSMAAGAQKSITLMHFYGVDREVGGTKLTAFLDALAAAAQRGVQVRALFDAGFAKRYAVLPRAIAMLPGAEVRTIDAKAHYGGVQHLKMLLVDEREAFVGSQNLDWRALEQILELGVRTDAPCVVAPLRDVFAHDWALAARKATAAASRPAADAGEAAAPRQCTANFGAAPVTVAVAASPQGWLPAGVTWDLPPLLQRIAAARSEIRLTMLSMHRHDRDGSDWPVLEDALVAAAERGVEVHVLLGHWSASKPERLQPLQAMAARHPKLHVKLLHIAAIRQPPIPYARVLHAKTGTFDGERAWIGTSNGSKGYFHASRNASVFVDGAALAGPLARWQAMLWQRPEARDVGSGVDAQGSR